LRHPAFYHYAFFVQSKTQLLQQLKLCDFVSELNITFSLSFR